MEPSALIRDAVARKTFAAFGAERLGALCRAVTTGRGSDFGPLSRVFQKLLQPWGERVIGERPRYRSNIADDEAPFEFAIALSPGETEVQVYVEAQGEAPTLGSNMDAGRSALELVASDLGASLERLRRVEDVFFPRQACDPFAIWIGASWAAGRGIKLKVYLNPQVRGRALASAVTAEAMRRLGFERGWARVRESLRAEDEIGIVSLDLSDSNDARVKVYLRHPGATVRDIDAMARLTRDYEPADIAPFYLALARSQGPFLRKPPLTEMVFVDPASDRPAAVTLEFPIGSYVETDEDASERIKHCLEAFTLPFDSYDRAARAFAMRPLAERSGIHAHVTLSRLPGGPRIGVYLASEAYVVAGNRAFKPEVKP